MATMTATKRPVKEGAGLVSSRVHPSRCQSSLQEAVRRPQHSSILPKTELDPAHQAHSVETVYCLRMLAGPDRELDLSPAMIHIAAQGSVLSHGCPYSVSTT